VTASLRSIKTWLLAAALLAVALIVAWRSALLFEAHSPRSLFHNSITLGADVPMRAELTMTWRRHGITHSTEAHVVQGAQGRYRMEYVSPPEAKGRILCSDGQTQWQVEPRRNMIATTPLMPESEQNERDTEALIAANYKIVLVSDDEITAGRPTYLLELLPRHEGKSSQKRWIDRQTYKTLRIETHYPDGILARMIAYTDLTLPARVTSADFTPPQDAGLKRVSSPVTSTILPVRNAALSVQSLGLRAEGALGFRLTQLASSAIDRARTAHLLYSDGIETVSVFVQNAGAAVAAPAPGWHPITILGRPAFENQDGHLDAVAYTQGAYRYTAVSHLGPQALQRFVASLFQ
jgi:outer membrane lipoprotein-sorting protein